MLPQIKKISVFRVTGLKILGRVGIHIFFFYGKNIILFILKGILPIKMHKIIFFPENLKKKIKVSRSKFTRYPLFIWISGRFGRNVINIGLKCRF